MKLPMKLEALSLALSVSALAGAAFAQAPATPAPPAAAALPATSAPVTSTYTPFAQPNPAVDIVATLTQAGQFTTLIKAIDAAGLTATLKQPGHLTLFAPTDAAFAALPAGTLDSLLKSENRSQLQRILLYHVINAPVTSAETVGHAAADIPTVVPGANPPLKLHVDGSSGKLLVNGAPVLQTDVKASNGYVQVIDKVLMPGA